MIALVGFTGAGKTTVGKTLARRYGLPCYDNDEWVEKTERMSIRDIFSSYGESHFRQLEARSISRLLLTKSIGVLVTGGGAPLDATTRELLLAHAFVVHIAVPIEETLRRLAADTTRPLTQGGDRERILALYNERQHLYDFAHQRVTGMDGEIAAATVLAGWLNAKKRG